ncbi:hypothetical protein N9Q68_00420 [Polaribacter sp.]|nr:hypothetical protein [Polaribacter sp.]
MKNKSTVKIILSFVFLSSVFFANAQTANFQWTDWKDNTDVGFQNPILAFPSDSGFTTYSVEETGTQVFPPKIIYISKFDSVANLTLTLEFQLPKRQQKEATLLKIIEGENKLYFFSYIALKKDKKNILYVQVYNNLNANISEPKELYTLSIDKVKYSGFFNTAISEDKKTLAVSVNLPYLKKTKENIAVLLFDAALNKISEVNRTLSFKSEKAYRENIFVSNEGITNIVKSTNFFKKNPVTSVITITSSTIEEETISSKGFYVSDSRVVTIKNKQYLIGFATNNWKPTISIGGRKDKSYFIYNISDRKLTINQEWSKETLKHALGKGFTGLTIKDVLMDNEKIYLIGDCKTKSSEVKSGANFEYNYTYTNGPGVIVKFDVTGKVDYDIVLKYYETYVNDKQKIASFYPYLKKGKLHVLVNEKESVIKKKKIVAGYNKINAKVITINTFDSLGERRTAPFWNSKVGGEQNIIDFAPTSTVRKNDTSFYIYAYGKKYYDFGVLSIE